MKKKREHYVTCGQMRLLEKRADEAGLSYYQMMENAGSGAAMKIIDIMSYRKVREDCRNTASQAAVAEETNVFDDLREDGRVLASGAVVNAVVFCGKGNNGGDGFVAARILCRAGYDVTVVLVDGKPVTQDAETNFRLVEELPVKIVDMTEDERALMDIRQIPHIAVDAIYGTGMRGELMGNGLKAAIYINRLSQNYGTTVFALDIPSGLGGDLTNEKELERRSVTADYTLVFHARKPVHLQKFAKDYCGRIIVIDIGIDQDRLWTVEY